MYYNVPVILKAGIMGVLCYSCLLLFESPLIQLTVGILVGSVSYLIMAYITKDETLIDVKNIVKGKLRRR